MANKSDVQLDTRQFEAALDRLMDKAERDIGRHLEAIGEDVTSRMADKAPQGRTGRLGSGVGHERGRDMRGPYVDVYVEPFYASFIEWGTRHMRARPFFRPSLLTIPKLFQRFRSLF